MFFHALISVAVITLLARLLGKISPLKLCPICAGVSLTWAWLLAAKVLGYPVDDLVLALLMGASVSGAAYKIEERFLAAHPYWLFKALFVIVGFMAVYSLLSEWWLMFGLMIFTLILIVLIFTVALFPKNPQDKKAVDDLEKKMDKCC